MYLGQQSWGQQQAKGAAKGAAKGQGKSFGKGKADGGKGCGKKGGKSTEVGAVASFKLVGCKDAVVGPIIRGTYQRSGENHGKPAFKKEGGKDGLVVLIYFWDARDGAAASGWWIGPSIGGNSVWGHHPNRTSASPPTTGWMAPHNLGEDPTVVLHPVGGAPQGKGCGKAGAQQVQHNAQAAQQRAAENKAKQEQMKAKQAEHVAATAIRKEIGKLKGALPNTIDKLKEDLGIAMGTEFDKCGSLQAKIQEEHDNALKMATERVEKMQELKEKREAAKEGAKQLLCELAELVEAAEQAAEESAGQLKALGEKSDLTTEAAIEKECKKFETETASFEEKVKAATDFVKEKSSEIRLAFPGNEKKQAPKDGEKKEEDFGDLSRRANLVRNKLEKDKSALQGVRRRLLTKAGAQEKMRKFKDTFTKYDKDKDGVLNGKEITALAKGEYSFALPSEYVDMILKSVASGGKGVKVDSFRRLLAIVGAARERAVDLERKSEREAKEAVVAEAKKKFTDAIEAVDALLKEATSALQELSAKTITLPKEAREMKSQEVLAKAGELEAASAAVAEKLTAAKEEAEKFGGGEVEVQLQGWVKGQKARMEGSEKNSSEKLNRVNSSIRNFKDQGATKNNAEVKVLGNQALARLRAYLKEKKTSQEQLFKELSKGAAGISAAAFAAFVHKLPKGPNEKDGEDLSVDDFKRGFGMFDEEKTGTMSSEVFSFYLRCMMKVVKDVALTNGLLIAESKVIRRLEKGEVVELLEGPVTEDKFVRVRCRALQGGAEGWATSVGNQGSVFLQEGGTTFKVVKETVLTDQFDVTAAPSADSKIHEKTRKVKVGEKFEVREWGRKDEATGLTRMKCRLNSDGAVGWITSITSAGVRFVEMV